MQKNRQGEPYKQSPTKTILLFVITAMLTTDRYPRANNKWEDQAKDQKTWANWKTRYKKAHAKARFKAQAAEGADKLGAANAERRVLKNSKETTDDGGDKVGLKALEGYFENLAAVDIDGNYRVITLIIKKYGNLPLCLENYALFLLSQFYKYFIYISIQLYNLSSRTIG